MQDESASSTAQPTSRRKWKFKWHHLYFLLAAFDLLTILVSLFLGDCILGIYSESVETHQQWTERRGRYEQLVELVAAINTPGNNVFDSKNVRSESAQLNRAVDQFNRFVNEIKQDLRLNVEEATARQLLISVNRIERTARHIEAEAKQVFFHMWENQPDLAGARMAAMDQHFFRSISQCSTLCQAVSSIQEAQFEEDTARAVVLGRFEFLIFGFVVLIVCGVTFYGHTLSREMAAADAAIKFNEGRVRTILETAADGIITTDEAGRIEVANPAAERMFGYAGDELKGTDLRVLMPALFSEVQDGRAVTIFETCGSSCETIGRRRSGTEFPIELSVSEGHFGGRKTLTAIIRDITERQQAETDIRDMAQLPSENPHPVLRISKAGTLMYANESSAEFLSTWGCQCGADVPADIQRIACKALKTGTNQLLEVQCAERVYSLTFTPVVESGYVSLYGRDITLIKQAEIELRTAAAAAEAANNAKSEFLANMSHEIRTPMTAILGFADVLLENVTKPESIDAAEIIRRNGEHLLEIINDILDLSKIESGKLEVERIECSPCLIASEVISLMRVRADAKGLTLNVEFDGPIPETIQSDPTRLRQILINLVGNAIKFTEVGSVRLVTKLLDDGAHEPTLQFDVIDTGMGLTEQQQSKLFQPFVQSDTSTTRKFGGTGLGLAISKRLAEVLGGDVTISSLPNKGSTFSVRVTTGPLNSVRMLRDPNQIVTDAVPFAGSDPQNAAKVNCRVLLAEDGPDNQRLIAFVLKKWGAEVTVADNGQIAVELIRSADAKGRPFDVILMDMQMPVLDGYAATRQLRRDGYTGPIVALTANAMAGDREKCLRAGCDEYAAKPIDRKKLLALIDSLTNRRAAEPVTSSVG